MVTDGQKMTAALSYAPLPRKRCGKSEGSDQAGQISQRLRSREIVIHYIAGPKGENNEVCVEGVCNSVSGDRTGRANQHRAQTQEAEAAATVTAADVQALKDAIASQQAALAQQQQQIQELRDELRTKDQAAQQAQTAAADAASKADAAQAQATQQQQAVTELKGDVTDLKTNVASTVVTVQETQKSLSATSDGDSRQRNHHYSRRISGG